MFLMSYLRNHCQMQNQLWILLISSIFPFSVSSISSLIFILFHGVLLIQHACLFFSFLRVKAEVMISKGFMLSNVSVQCYARSSKGEL